MKKTGYTGMISMEGNWHDIETQAPVALDVLSQLLLDALEQHESDPITTSTTEDNDNHVS